MANILFGQTNDFLWAKQFGNINGGEGLSISADGSGNVYSTGNFSGTVDFDPGPGTYNLNGGGTYVSKLDALGNFLWAYNFVDVNGKFSAIDASGNVYTTGYFTGTVDFNAGPGIYNLTSAGGFDIFISKLDAFGNFLWAKQLGGASDDKGISITVDSIGNVYTTGVFWFTADFDPGPGNYSLSSAGFSDMFISKIDHSGNFLFAKKIGDASSTEEGESITIDGAGNIYTTGIYNLAPTHQNGREHFFVSKLDASGNLVWKKQFAGIYGEVSYSIAVDFLGNVYTTGNFQGTVDFNPGIDINNLTSVGNVNPDIFILKLDALGNFLWANQIGGVEYDRGNSIVIDFAGNAYVTGFFKGIVDFDPGIGYYNLSSMGSTDIFISHFNTMGNFLWAKQIGGVGADNGNSIALDIVGNVYVTGFFTGTVDFNSGAGTYNMTSSGNYDIFVVKLKGDPEVYTQPKIYSSKAILNVGETQNITGKDFSSNGPINLIIENGMGELMPTNNSFAYLTNGSFSYQLPIVSTMHGGEYKVFAIDSLSGQITSSIKFFVINSVSKKLWIKEPINLGNYEVNKSINISWGDFVTNTNVSGASGFVQKRYKIEYSNNNGSSWVLIENEKLCINLRSNQDNTCNISPYTFLQTGNYQIKVTDLDNPANFNVSSFTIGIGASNSFITSLEWDQSIPSRNDNPVGLAADGTSRIIIKLNKTPTNIKLVKAISAHIEIDGGANLTGIDMLGKIMPTQNSSNYNEEANSANTINADTIFNAPYADNVFRFWLVAPDNFTQDQVSQDAERAIKVIFDITYSDNSIEQIQVKKIRIVRPPLMMVHGLNGSPGSFDKMKYDIGGQVRYFQYAGGADGLFKNLKKVNLKNYAAFKTNAEILLGIGDIAYRLNSFQRTLKEFHDLGFAANKVDYVCHSMGGNIARTIINQYDNYYRPTAQNTNFPYKNYGKGFINKLITINTPHNGSPVADFIDDLIGAGVTTYSFISSKDNLGGYFTKKTSNNIFTRYEASPAIKDLRAVNGGIRFNTTSVKNHMIGGDIARINLPDALATVIANDPQLYIDYMEVMAALLPAPHVLGTFGLTILGIDAVVNSLNAFISLKYNYGNFLNNSDGIVPISSQFVGRSQNTIPEIEGNLSTIDNVTLGYGLKRNHIKITDDLAVGNTVMRLLNAKINSGYFSDQIPANNTPGGTAYRETNTTSIQDSIFYYTDTSFIQIMSPSSSDEVLVDSVIDINLIIKDTVNLKQIRLFFQGQLYQSNSRIFNQSFNIKVNSNAIGKSVLAVDAIYDSLGFTIYHTDTATIKVTSLDILQGIYLTPKTQNLNIEHIFNLMVNGIYNSYIGTLQNNIDSLVFSISDTNVVRFDSLTFQFITKDTGTAYIIYNYKGYTDTAFIYISIPENENKVNICPQGNISFFAGTNDITKSYQWQVDIGTGFEDITPNSVYSGINSSTLLLNNAPSTYYNFKYRCLISDLIGQSISQEFRLKFATSWNGAYDTAWENPVNWDCGSLPDSNTDVTIKSTSPNFPKVNSNALCKSLQLEPGSAVQVKTGYKLDITGQNQ